MVRWLQCIFTRQFWIMFCLALISCLESMLRNMKDLFHTGFWPHIAPITCNSCNQNPPVIKYSIFLWAVSDTEVSLRFRSFICYPFAKVPWNQSSSSDISPVTIPLHSAEENCLEVSSCHFLPLHAQTLTSISNLIANKILSKRAEEKQAYGGDWKTWLFSIHSHLCCCLPLYLPLCLPHFFSFITYLSSKEGGNLLGGGLICIFVFSSRCYHTLNH